jgi:hypothetical protein
MSTGHAETLAQRIMTVLNPTHQKCSNMSGLQQNILRICRTSRAAQVELKYTYTVDILDCRHVARTAEKRNA